MEGKYDAPRSMPIIQAYRSLIQEARGTQLHQLLYEFLGDFSYSNSKSAFIHLSKTSKGTTYLYMGMEHGPQSKETLQKLLQFRISGTSNEIGHQGGGNKWCQFGTAPSSCISFCSMLNEHEYITAEIKPNEIFELSNSTVSETEFQQAVDGKCINWPSQLDYDEEFSWFKDYRTKMKNLGHSVNYVVRYTITDSKFRPEFVDKKAWRGLIYKIQLINYDINILFKNELVGEDQFTQYENIDMIGLKHKTDEHTFQLYIHNTDYILKNNDDYITTNGDVIQYKTSFQLLGDLILYKIDPTYLKQQLAILNQNTDEKLNQETFYGFYPLLNEKQINCYPLPLMLPSKSQPEIGNSLARLLFKPSLSCSNAILEQFLRTDTNKAKTSLRHVELTRKILNQIINIIKKDPLQIQLIKKTTVIKPGQGYIGTFDHGLYKFGIVSDTENLKKRTKQHEKESIKNVKTFCKIDTDMLYYKPLHYTTPLTNPKSFEEHVKHLLYEHRYYNGVEKLKFWENKGSKNDTREYFMCEDPEYIMEYILPLIFKIQHKF